ncbi:MAG: rhamnulokinase [Kiritimatiellae bacterium]|nr:rhamnulokinase [Kiritimatiellia bacterium]
MKYALAIDIGASSGRHILSHIEDGKMILEEVYRFDNSQVVVNGHDCWDIEALFGHVVAGIKAAAPKKPATIGIDTWGVDFVLLDKDMTLCSDAVAYRDKRTEGADAIVEAAIAPEELYSIAGIQKTPFNTIYQLAALKKESPEQLEKAQRLLMVPDYLNFRLTGKIANEYTNASTTGLLDARAKTWARDVIERLGLPQRIFGELSMPGTRLGNLLPEIAAEAGFDAEVILPATHDTGSAYLAVPARDGNAVYLSSGTWSLLGVENEEPITSLESYRANFTNEGGAWYRFRYLKNIMGLWMIQSVRRELNGVAYVEGKENARVPLTDWEEGRKYSFAELEEAAKKSTFAETVDVADNRFLAPESMIAEVRAACKTPPQTIGDTMRCVYLSLAKCYADAVETLAHLTGSEYTSLNIVGGGSKDGYLNALTAKATGLEVFAGPTEGTAIGNLIVQHIAQG